MRGFASTVHDAWRQWRPTAPSWPRRLTLGVALTALGGCPAVVTPEVRPTPDVSVTGDPTPTGTGPLTVHYRPIACAGGSLFPARVLVAGAVVAEVAPGSEARLEVALGAVQVVAGDTTEVAQVTASGAEVTLGCVLETFRGAGLQPLTVVAPEARCTALGAVRVRAGGPSRQLVRGERWTVLVPRGNHVVRFRFEGEGEREREATVAIGDGDGALGAAVSPGAAVNTVVLAPDCTPLPTAPARRPDR